MARPRAGEPPVQGWAGPPHFFEPPAVGSIQRTKGGLARWEPRPDHRPPRGPPWPGSSRIAASSRSPRATEPGEPETARRDLRKFLPIWGHLALLLAVMKVYHVEGRALFLLTSIALAALPVHYLLAYRWKKPFFLAVSVVGLFAVFGVVAGLGRHGAGAGLHRRLPPADRLVGRGPAIVAVAAIGLGFARASIGRPRAWLDVAWPVLGSMLMFRMILYLYEIKHAEEPEPLVDTLGYFFLLPNYAFLLFPVVDYRTLEAGLLRRRHPRDPGHRPADDLQRRGPASGLPAGVSRAADPGRGGPQPGDACSPSSPAITCSTSRSRASSTSPAGCSTCSATSCRTTHHNYLLATGFTDYWRRINIYWKDFMIRVVFNPVAFRLKRKPRWVTLSAATTAVFLATWVLHGYQMFWLKGTWGFSVPDALFWGILGTLGAGQRPVGREGEAPEAGPGRTAARWPSGPARRSPRSRRSRSSGRSGAARASPPGSACSAERSGV